MGAWRARGMGARGLEDVGSSRIRGAGAAQRAAAPGGWVRTLHLLTLAALNSPTRLGPAHLQSEVAAIIFRSYECRTKRLEAARNALMDQLCGGAPGDPEALQQLARVRFGMALNFMSHILAFFDGVMAVKQFCDFSIAVVPRTLSFEQVERAIELHQQALRAKCGKCPAAPSSAAAPSGSAAPSAATAPTAAAGMP